MSDLDRLEAKAEAQVAAVESFLKKAYAFVLAHKGAVCFAIGLIVGLVL